MDRAKKPQFPEPAGSLWQITMSNKSASLQYSKWNGQWPSLAHCPQNQCFVLMYKIVHNLVALQSSSLIPADLLTRAHHSYKFRTITTNKFFLGTIPQWNTLKITIVDNDSFDIFITCRSSLPLQLVIGMISQYKVSLLIIKQKQKLNCCQ